jgi:hypothetical protein
LRQAPAPPIAGWPPPSAGESGPFALPALPGFIARTDPSVPASRIGSRLLMGPPLGDLPWHQGAGSHVLHKSLKLVSRRLHAGRRSANQQAPSELHPRPTTGAWFRRHPYAFDTSSTVGIEVWRACILGYGGESSGFPLGLNPAPIMLTFPQASLRSRAAGFPRLGSDLGISSAGRPNAVKLKCWHTYTPPSLVCLAD